MDCMRGTGRAVLAAQRPVSPVRSCMPLLDFSYVNDCAMVPQVHVKERLDAYKATHGLAAASEWKVGTWHHHGLLLAERSWLGGC